MEDFAYLCLFVSAMLLILLVGLCVTALLFPLGRSDDTEEQ